MVEGHVAAFETYRHTPVVVGVDIYNLETEAFGNVIAKPDGDGIPAPHQYLCEEGADILELDDFDPAISGRLAMIIEAAKELKQRLPDAVVKVPVSGPFSLASNLCGLENAILKSRSGGSCSCRAFVTTKSTIVDLVVTGELGFNFHLQSSIHFDNLLALIFRRMEFLRQEGVEGHGLRIGMVVHSDKLKKRLFGEAVFFK